MPDSPEQTQRMGDETGAGGAGPDLLTTEMLGEILSARETL